ncbi:hypothetical protein Q7689_01030 [Nocardiopsis tropica]|uniref:hypothetical protein n=1 Tax=Nocardiopsis tropica TaxID=109330 RepID=UPI002E8C6D3A|nr:hypothetical protein [Nocardiopsis tropica]
MIPIATKTVPTVRESITRLRELWPLGTRVTHIETGTSGVVALVDPDRVLGTALPGEASAWCLLPSKVTGDWQIGSSQSRIPGRGAAVAVELDTHDVVWVRTDFLLRTTAPKPTGRRRSRKSSRRDR